MTDVLWVGDGHVLDQAEVCIRCGACRCCKSDHLLKRQCAGAFWTLTEQHLDHAVKGGGVK